MNNTQQPAPKRVNLVPILGSNAPEPAKRRLIIPTSDTLNPAPQQVSVPQTGSAPQPSAPVQQQPAYIPPTSAPVQQQPAYIPPTSAPVQQQPAYAPQLSAPEQAPSQPASSPVPEDLNRIVAMTVMQVLKQLEQDYGINVVNRKQAPTQQPTYAPQVSAPVQQPSYAQQPAPVQQPAYAQQPVYGQQPPMQQFGYAQQPVAPARPWDGTPRGIPGPWNMIIAMRTCIKRYAEFKGRASRPEFWFAMLFHGVVNLLFMILIALSFDSPGAMIGDAVVWMLYNLGAATPVIAAAFRRMHDAGLSAKKLWFYFIPLAGPIIVICDLCRPTTGPNEFGVAPDYPDPVGSK